MKIQSISAFQIYDSRGNPTLEAEVTLEDGSSGCGLVPSGASTGQYEALELRDGDSARFRGRSVFRAIKNVHTLIAPALIGMDAADQSGVDDAMRKLDGTPNKSRLGANAILGVSMAVADAAAAAEGVPLWASLGNGQGALLPLPEIQIFGGGAHADWRLDIQDFMVIAVGARSYAEALEMTFNVYHAAGEIMRRSGKLLGLAEEGGYWPEFASHEEAIETLLSAILDAGYTPGTEMGLSLDIAASDLYEAARCDYRFENRRLSPKSFAELLIDWCTRYPIASIEDPMADTDWDGWRRVYDAIGDRVQVVGDDLFTTNVDRIRTGIERNAANAVLIKLNQIGTVTETIEAIRVTQEVGWAPIVSARSGETEDAFISHLAVATNAGQLKVGAFARSERMAKWNEILRIERSLGDRAQFVGPVSLGHKMSPARPAP
jgi:enolase